MSQILVYSGAYVPLSISILSHLCCRVILLGTYNIMQIQRCRKFFQSSNLFRRSKVEISPEIPASSLEIAGYLPFRILCIVSWMYGPYRCYTERSFMINSYQMIDFTFTIQAGTGRGKWLLSHFIKLPHVMRSWFAYIPRK